MDVGTSISEATDLIVNSEPPIFIGRGALGSCCKGRGIEDDGNLLHTVPFSSGGVS